jgi:hypothetical protein
VNSRLLVVGNYCIARLGGRLVWWVELLVALLFAVIMVIGIRRGEFSKHGVEIARRDDNSIGFWLTALLFGSVALGFLIHGLYTGAQKDFSFP